MRNTAIALKTSENGLNTLLQVLQTIIGIIKEIIGIIQGLIRNTQEILIILRKTNPGSFGFRDFLYFINLASLI